jgi:hypothetical protein
MDFESMTIPQLKDIARANNLKKWSKLKKADLIQFLIDNVPGGARGGRPPSPSRGRGRTPRRPSPQPRSKTPPRPRRKPPSPQPSRKTPPRPRSKTPPRPRSKTPPRPRSKTPSRGRSGSFGVARLKKRQCVKNLRKDVVAAAEDYGIAITKAGGKKKTIKELCAELEVVVAQQPQMPIVATPPRTRTPSPVKRAVMMPRPPTPPITTAVPVGMVPKAVVYALTNIELDTDYMPKADLLKPKVVTKPKLVLYAQELGIRGKSLTKEVLLDRIIAAQMAKDIPVIAQAIRDESSLIVDEIVDRVSEQMAASGEQPPDQEEVQAVVEQRVSTGESVSAEAVADEIIAEKQSKDIIASRPSSSSRSSMSSRSSRSSMSSRSSRSMSSRSSRSSMSSRSSRSSMSSRSSRSLSSQASSLMSSRSSMSNSAMTSVANSVSVASKISNKVAKDIVNEVADRTDKASVRRTINEVVEDQGVNLDVDPKRLEEVIADEQAREAVESVVSRAAENGLISEKEEEEILQPLRDDQIPASSVVPGPLKGARPRAQPQPIKRQIRGERDIEKLLREVQKPEESISNMPAVKYRVLRCFGLIN